LVYALIVSCFEESGVYFPKNKNPTKSSSEQIDKLLLTFATDLRNQMGIQVKSPAIITDSEDHLLCLAVSKEGGLPFESPTTLALRATSQQLGVPELAGRGLSIHVLQDPNGEIDALGDIYNFGPDRVIIGSKSPDVAQVVGELHSDEYWQEAALRRNISLEILKPSSSQPRPIKLSTGDFYKTQFKIPEVLPSSFSAQIIKKWANVRVNTSDQTQLRELMTDLHLLAAQNVAEQGGPFAAFVINPDGTVLGLGENQVVRGSDPSAHGERVALWSAVHQLEQEGGEILSLEDCTVVTSSFTCIGCAEACARAGIKEIIYGNSRDTVQAMTPFTEGPLDNDKLAKRNIILREVAIESNLAEAGFRAFQKLIEGEPDKGYLTDLGRNQSHK